MKTFFNILQTLINITNKRYPDEPFNVPNDITDYIYFGEQGHIMCLIDSIYYKIKDDL